jgi:polyribonucleotide nucleotidyltransferase
VASRESADYPVFLPYTDEFYAFVEKETEAELAKIYQVADKQSRQDQDDTYKAAVKEKLAASVSEEDMNMFSAAYKSVTKKVMRKRVLEEGIRIDGRGLARYQKARC